MFIKGFPSFYDDSLILNFRRSEDPEKRYRHSILQNSFTLHTTHVFRKGIHIDVIDIDQVSPNPIMDLLNDLLLKESHYIIPPLFGFRNPILFVVTKIRNRSPFKFYGFLLFVL